MNYKLLNKRIGVNPSVVFQFSLPEEIVDFSCFNDSFVFLSKKQLLVRDGDSIRQYGRFEFNHATSLFWLKNNNRIYVAEDGGRRVLEISSEDFLPRNYLNENECAYMDHELRKLGKTTAKIKLDKYGNCYCMVKEANRVFFKSTAFTKIKCLAGNGFAGYSQSTQAEASSLNFPTSIDVDNKTLYIADSGNNVIRSLDGNSLKIIMGHPLKNVIAPSQLVVTKDILYYVSNNVYTTNVKNPVHKDISLYKPNGEILISKNWESENSLYILETYAS